MKHYVNTFWTLSRNLAQKHLNSEAPSLRNQSFSNQPKIRITYAQLHREETSLNFCGSHYCLSASQKASIQQRIFTSKSFSFPLLATHKILNLTCYLSALNKLHREVKTTLPDRNNPPHFKISAFFNCSSPLLSLLGKIGHRMAV